MSVISLVQRDGGDFAVLHIALAADEHDVAGVDPVAGHGIALGDERKVAGEVVFNADVLGAVSRLVDGFAAGGGAQNRHALAPPHGQRLRRQDGRFAGEGGERKAQFLRIFCDDGQARARAFWSRSG